ncbi:YdcF family protein [Dyadobacter psychrotolerans]|uniref:YdcF family protein n=1 Tax=Dyadobacter psychrotolerans TaxID=2541721 RepID=A0A4R5DUM6_9BACT|nr:YdcF family protein [Dyadobacter psychrotolerans]TDE14663.1 YdcF family protein [Dyadobacter psychrotolerans]
MPKFSLLLLLFFVALISFGQDQKKPDPNYKLLVGNAVVQSKNYYLFTLFEQIPAVKLLLEKDEKLSKLAKDKFNNLENSVKTCKNDYLCFTTRMKFTEEEISLVSQRLAELYSEKNALGKLVSEHLIASGTYILFHKSSPKEILVKAWEQDARGINHVIEVYAEGKKPNYPAIDSIGFRTRSKSYPVLVYDCAEMVRQERKNPGLFFAPSMNFALQFLEVNERNEVADYEPMVSTVNKAAYEKVKKIDWNKFKYTLILVPGAGPDTHDRALSEGGILRCRVAALRYFEGLAPFIVVSGGRVHPYKTKYSEAFEMKKFLMETLKVPEHAIIMDPHARHTTTNMRNGVRLLFRYGMPFDKPCLVSTMRAQSYYITNDAFVTRCQKEINHVPYKLGNRLSETDFEFYPVIDALHIDADEPLDP